MLPPVINDTQYSYLPNPADSDLKTGHLPLATQGPKNKKGPAAHSLSAQSLPATCCGSDYLPANGAIINANPVNASPASVQCGQIRSGQKPKSPLKGP